MKEVFISHSTRPEERLYPLSLHVKSVSQDIAILFSPSVQFHRLAIDEELVSYMPVYHVECLDIDNPLVHKGRYVDTKSSGTVYGCMDGPSEPGFSGGPVLNI